MKKEKSELDFANLNRKIIKFCKRKGALYPVPGMFAKNPYDLLVSSWTLQRGIILETSTVRSNKSVKTKTKSKARAGGTEFYSKSENDPVPVMFATNP